MAHDLQSAAQHLTFRVGGSHLALPIEGVREVARMPRLSRVLHAPPALLGLVNFRGTVIPVLSAAALLESGGGELSRLIVIDTGELLGLAVDDASQVVRSEDVELVDIAALAARSMPERSAPRRSHEATTALLADVASDHATTTLVIFAIGDQEFALPAAAVDRIAPMPAEIAPLPDADEVVIGNAAFGDAVLPLLSLRALLALPKSGQIARPRVVVVHIGDDRVGLMVDAMRGIVQVADGQIDPLPKAMRRGQAEARISAICRLDQGERLVSILAADLLLRDDVTATMMADAHAEADRAAPVAAVETEQFLIFQIGSDQFGIPVEAVDEVSLLPGTLARLPNAPAFVMGAMNLRGQVIPVIDQAVRFGAQSGTGSRRRVIVVRVGEVQAGFVVDAIAHIVRVDTADVRPAPDLGNSETRVFERVIGLAGEGRVILIVSPRTLLDRAEQDLLASFARKETRARS